MGIPGAAYLIEVEGLQSLGDRTPGTTSDLPAIQLPDRQHLGGCAGEERLVRNVDLIPGNPPLENVFIVRNGVIHTPELTSCLDGITRDSVITLAREAGYDIRRSRMYSAKVS